MGQQVRIEIKGRDQFWSRAFHVEWEYQFPERKLTPDGPDYLLAELEWLDDLSRVGEQTFCRVLRAPDNPRRRRWISSLIPPREKD